MRYTTEKEKQEVRTVREKAQEEKSCQLRQRLQLLLELPLTDPQQKEVLKEAGLPVRYRDRLQLIAWNLYQKALEGDQNRPPKRGKGVYRVSRVSHRW